MFSLWIEPTFTLLLSVPLVQSGVVWMPIDVEQDPVEHTTSGRPLQSHLDPRPHSLRQVRTLSSRRLFVFFSTIYASGQDAENETRLPKPQLSPFLPSPPPPEKKVQIRSEVSVCFSQGVKTGLRTPPAGTSGTSRSIDHLEKRDIERQLRLWWTVYQDGTRLKKIVDFGKQWNLHDNIEKKTWLSGVQTVFLESVDTMNC